MLCYVRWQCVLGKHVFSWFSMNYQNKGLDKILTYIGGHGDLRSWCFFDAVMQWIKFTVLWWSQILWCAMSVFFAVLWFGGCCGVQGLPMPPSFGKLMLDWADNTCEKKLCCVIEAVAEVAKLSIKHLKQHNKSSTKMYHGRDKELRLLIRLEWLANGCHLSRSFLSSQSD